ncbi:thioredoxin family protein [Nocardioides sp. R1-1]|uniref:thioredoxin family protein n=1 Tax=Nocardioides sp. R1-1 TaxID=3383502 RepID=UPI0038D03F54
MTGLALLGLALAVAVGFGLYRRRTDGRFAAPARRPAGGTSQPVAEPVVEPVVEVRGVPATSLETTPWSTVAAAVPGAVLGERATLLQFSSAFCAPCRTTRVVLADVARTVDGVVHVEVDAEQHLELVRALDVRRTPTTLVLDRDGNEVTRAAGAPRRDQVLSALPALQESR